MEYVQISAQEAWKGETISHYEMARPTYPVEVIQTLLNGTTSFPDKNTTDRVQPFTILELGAGTGKFTRGLVHELAGKNVKLIVSEPLPAMCDKLKEFVTDDVQILQCAAQNIPLENESVDAILAVQCIHWFSGDKKALGEIARVLKRRGTLALLWLRVDSSYSWVAEEKKIRSLYYEMENAPWEETGQWKHDLEESQLFSIRNEMRKDVAPQAMDLDGLVRRLLSISVIAKQSSETKEKIAEEYRSKLKNHPDLKGKEVIDLPFHALFCWCDKI